MKCESKKWEIMLQNERKTEKKRQKKKGELFRK